MRVSRCRRECVRARARVRLRKSTLTNGPFALVPAARFVLRLRWRKRFATFRIGVHKFRATFTHVFPLVGRVISYLPQN